MRDLAARLVAHEASVSSPADARTSAAFRVCEKLRQPLAALAGAAGFRSLLSRALVIAQREAPGLSRIRVNADGSLGDVGAVRGLSNQDPKPNDAPQDAPQNLPQPGTDEGTLLVAQLLGLLHIFIGEAITLRLARDIWPNASVHRTESGRDQQA
jgi:hypothetical protein